MTKPVRLLNCLLAASCLALLATARPTAAAGPERELEAAAEAAADFKYGEALALYRAAAELGDVRAQRTIGLMLLKGESLYGPEVKADRAEAIKWLSRAAAGGCDVSRYVLARLR